MRQNIMAGTIWWGKAANFMVVRKQRESLLYNKVPAKPTKL
jgi:hypothetical protein